MGPSGKVFAEVAGVIVFLVTILLVAQYSALDSEEWGIAVHDRSDNTNDEGSEATADVDESIYAGLLGGTLAMEIDGSDSSLVTMEEEFEWGDGNSLFLPTDDAQMLEAGTTAFYLTVLGLLLAFCGIVGLCMRAGAYYYFSSPSNQQYKFSRVVGGGTALILILAGVALVIAYTSWLVDRPEHITIKALDHDTPVEIESSMALYLTVGISVLLFVMAFVTIVLECVHYRWTRDGSPKGYVEVIEEEEEEEEVLVVEEV
eukprot:TRINITY_DN13056_c0_g1_i1.p1 TRINITY_DN13056_c0_g1~~TRINITY_DN13056_c0_g1_i1.p1  ORF type:complete len:259 (-),score=63.24 TRINITY_DN13056_c0_g1_i1:41-817(-)